MMADFGQFQGLLGDRGRLLGIGSGTVIVEPKPAGDTHSTHSTSVSHVVSSGSYVDNGGHVHAVLFDQVTTADDGPPPSVGQVLEILSDVPIT